MRMFRALTTAWTTSMMTSTSTILSTVESPLMLRMSKKMIMATMAMSRTSAQPKLRKPHMPVACSNIAYKVTNNSCTKKTGPASCVQRRL